VRSSKTWSGLLSPTERSFFVDVLDPTPELTDEFVRFKKEYGFPEVENPPAPRRNKVFLNIKQKIPS
jgi:hypothetical protein